MQKMVHEIGQVLRYMVNTVINMHIYIHSRGKVWFDKYPNTKSIFPRLRDFSYILFVSKVAAVAFTIKEEEAKV